MARGGDPHHLGATWDGTGTNFAVYSAAADSVELCLIDEAGAESRLTLAATRDVWHARVDGIGPGTRYGFRVSGDRPCDPAKLLVDPYSRAIVGEYRWHPDLFAPGVDSAPFVVHGLVVDETFDWQGDRPLGSAWSDTVIYEAHVKGLTALHPDIPPQLRGTYAALGHPAVVGHLRELGVTALELLPVHAFVHDRRLAALGLRNYWGYNTLGFFAPHAGYAAAAEPGGEVAEFKTMVRGLHAAGIEVILDVVYNHTAEAGASPPPLLSLRGLDAAAYYRFVDGDVDRPLDWTGCGNTLNCDHPAALRLVLDSLRHWVTNFHIDGFRFDLAPVLGRDGGRFDPGAALFDAIWADPVLSRVKLIAEPWDLGPDGYVAGRFPVGWSEWNGQHRDTVRDYWRGRAPRADLAGALAGNAEAYGTASREAFASVNFVTCHDGFTLADLVSYDHKHNAANGEDGRDGTDDNRSWNGGVEGATRDEAVLRARRRRQRSLLATVLVSVGVPMVLAGDELGRSQQGNNNAYCHDGPMSWLDWSGAHGPTGPDDGSLVELVARLSRLRRRHPVYRSPRWPSGRPHPVSGRVDLAWFDADGQPMDDSRWWVPGPQPLLALFDDVNAHWALDEPPATPEQLAVLTNPSGEDREFILPEPFPAGVGAARWGVVVDTATVHEPPGGRQVDAGSRFVVAGHCLVVLEGIA